ncbi:hypothetical protein LTR16_001730, partial [Cryomyces antarcticus]
VDYEILRSHLDLKSAKAARDAWRLVKKKLFAEDGTPLAASRPTNNLTKNNSNLEKPSNGSEKVVSSKSGGGKKRKAAAAGDGDGDGDGDGVGYGYGS